MADIKYSSTAAHESKSSSKQLSGKIIIYKWPGWQLSMSAVVMLGLAWCPFSQPAQRATRLPLPAGGA
jgi:hypothetical protein